MTVRQLLPRVPAFVRYHGLTLALLAMLVWLTMRSSGLSPWLFADELYYDRGARLLAPGTSILPDHLYFAVYRFTSMCGPGFLDCARLFNCLFYVGAAPFLYQVARGVCSRGVAGAIVVLALLGPMNLLTAYFMPEAMYFMLFCVFAWATLRYRAAPPLAYGMLTGALLGLMSLVKPHALFLLPALLAFMGYLLWQGAPGAARRRAALRMLASAPLTLLAVKLGLGYLLAGAPALSLFGAFYGGMGANSVGGPILALAWPALVSLNAHVLAMALLFALPIATLLLHASAPGLRAVQSPDVRALQVFTVLMLGAAMTVTVLFTAKLGEVSRSEMLRVHQRYYDFVFPLLLIIAAAALAGPGAAVRVTARQRVLVALAVGLPMLIGAHYYAPSRFEPTRIDSPELFGFLGHPHGSAVLVAMTLALLVLWCWRRALATRLFVFVLLPCTAWQGADVVGEALARTRKQDGFDRAAQMAKAYLPKADLKRLTVLGDDGWAGLQRVVFELDDIDITTRQLAPGVALTIDVPHPVSPQALGLNTDPRALGVRVISLDIGERP